MIDGAMKAAYEQQQRARQEGGRQAARMRKVNQLTRHLRSMSNERERLSAPAWTVHAQAAAWRIGLAPKQFRVLVAAVELGFELTPDALLKRGVSGKIAAQLEKAGEKATRQLVRRELSKVFAQIGSDR